ncbi:stage II sporulation protein M [Methanobrevibacter sp.]|uniref:stage II sporulation protein M n=1 Tax=Methanobrevibacter sp. TaxID=66852 RepID=UPI00386B259D
MLNEIKRSFAENKIAIIISVAILGISLILGYCLEGYLYSYLNPVVEELTKKVQSGALKITFQDIFLNNLRVICVMFVFGIIFCFSAVMLAFNGFFVGYYVGSTHDLFTVLMYIIPHGIFELPSCALACAASFVLFNFIYKFIKALLKDTNDNVSDLIRSSYDKTDDKLKQAVILFIVSVILMIIAGVIEAYFTVPIAQFIFSILG